ncbi:MAG TPA: hypothetical protein VM307_06840 [Egibacteraceae bacterium]|nr:hypothetical protein [Egibacteraceae bacterium]
MTRPPVAARLAALRQRRAPDADAVCDAVRDLVVVCSSSRSGSSLVGELLRRSPQLLTFSAEINPHVTIPTIGSTGCDVLGDPTPLAGTPSGLHVLRGELAADLGSSTAEVDTAALADHVAWRLTMQWPDEEIDPGRVRGWVADVLAVRGDGALRDRAGFCLDLLRRVVAAHPGVNPYRYDIPDARVSEAFPQATVPAGPTAAPVVEMAPFVLPRPWRRATAAEAATKPVVAVTPRNAYRVPLLAAAFPNARVRIVHLTRNPAAAVNGLIDGWRHRGFFSCRSEVPLEIAGYTDRFPAWGDRWWNYDVPPGWRDWVQRPLAEVCAFQWRAAQEATLDRVARGRHDSTRLAFEDIVGAADRRWKALRGLCSWLGVDPSPVVGDDRLPVVMPTAAPRPRRWADNADELATVLVDKATVDVAAELGYSRDPAAWE